MQYLVQLEGIFSNLILKITFRILFDIISKKNLATSIIAKVLRIVYGIYPSFR